MTSYEDWTANREEPMLLAHSIEGDTGGNVGSITGGSMVID